MLVLFLAFFAFLHCWLNAFAEMLRFADRMFYKVHPLTLSTTGTFKCPRLFHLVAFYILIILIFTGLVEFNFFCQLLPHVECSGARLAVLLHVPGLSLGRWLSDEPICRRLKGL